MRPDDIELLAVPGRPALSGTTLLVGVTHPNIDANSYQGGLHRVALDGVATTRWTHGYRDIAPTISPDGRWVAFMRATGGAGQEARAQLYVMPVDGGDARRLTEAPLGVAEPVWSPDSRRIAYTARIPEPGRYGTSADPDAEPPTPAAEAPRRITRLDYRIDNIGFLGDRVSRLFVVDALADAEPVELTDGRTDVSSPVWAPDGRHVIFSAARDWGVLETQHTDLYAVSVEGGAPVVVVRSEGDADLPTVTADGEVVFLGMEFTGIHLTARNTGLWTAPLRFDGDPAPARRLTDVETVDCERSAGPPVVTADGVLVGVRNRGAVELRLVPLAANGLTLADTTLVAGERGVVKGFAAERGRVVAVVSTPDSPGEVVLCENGTTRVLTNFAEPLWAAGVRPVRELTGRSPDGYETHGWLVLPEGDGPHPVLLHVHGGPFAYHGWGFFDEAQTYASAGYAVVLANPRGSAGYGQQHGRAIIEAFGTVDMDDVLSVLDAALAQPECDADRVGVMGGSYGGFMTSWLASHQGDRFKAAWSERAVNAWDSFTGSSDIGYMFTEAYLGPDPDAHVKMSPLTYADRIRIPFAVVHSEEDWRCPIEQAQRMFVALRRSGVDVEMLVFPGEGHELSRSGQPRHRTQRLAAVLEWWGRHLGQPGQDSSV